MDVLVEVEGRQHEDLGLRMAGHDFLGGAQTIEDRHPDIHEDNVGGQFVDELYGLSSVISLSDDGHIRLSVKDEAEPGAHHLLVVG